MLCTGMAFSQEILDFQHCKLTTLEFFLIFFFLVFLDILQLPLKENLLFPAFWGNMNGSDGMFLYNLVWSIFLGPYTVKYFLYQYLRYCLGLLFAKF